MSRKIDFNRTPSSFFVSFSSSFLISTKNFGAGRKNNIVSQTFWNVPLSASSQAENEKNVMVGEQEENKNMASKIFHCDNDYKIDNSETSTFMVITTTTEDMTQNIVWTNNYENEEQRKVAGILNANDNNNDDENAEVQTSKYDHYNLS